MNSTISDIQKVKAEIGTINSHGEIWWGDPNSNDRMYDELEIRTVTIPDEKGKIIQVRFVGKKGWGLFYCLFDDTYHAVFCYGRVFRIIEYLENCAK